MACKMALRFLSPCLKLMPQFGHQQHPQPPIKSPPKTHFCGGPPAPFGRGDPSHVWSNFFSTSLSTLSTVCTPAVARENQTTTIKFPKLFFPGLLRLPYRCPSLSQNFRHGDVFEWRQKGKGIGPTQFFHWKIRRKGALDAMRHPFGPRRPPGAAEHTNPTWSLCTRWSTDPVFARHERPGRRTPPPYRWGRAFPQ